MRAVMSWVVVLILGALAALALIWVGQRRLIYFPTQTLTDPATLPISVEEVSYPTTDDLTMSAWFVSGGGGGVVIVFNGNAGNRADRLPLASGLAQAGHSVLLVDYRGYGGNPGRPSEAGLALDAVAAREYLRTRPDVDLHRIAYFGESLGAAVALGLAGDEAPAALVLRSPFTSLSDVGSHHYPFLPVSLILRDRYPNLETIGAVEAPVLVLAGEADSIVPFDQSAELFDAATGPKRLVAIEGADHNDFALTAGPELLSEVVAFLDEVMTPGGG